MRTTTTKGSPPQRLRVGILQNGRLIEERVLGAGRAITVGQSEHNTFIVPSVALPQSWRLFDGRRDGRARLQLHDSMQARIGKDGQVFQPSERQVALPDRTRGRITTGDVTILFQLLPPATPQPRAQLPASLRGSLWSRVDGWFTSLVLASLTAHMGMVVYLKSVDWPRRPDPEVVPDRFVRLVVTRPVRATAPPPRVSPPSPVATPSPHPQPSQTRSTPVTTPAPQANVDERRRALAEKASRMGLLAVLGNRSSEGTGAIVDLLHKGGIDEDQERALRDVGGLRYASTDTDLRGLGHVRGDTGRVAAVAALVDRMQIATQAPTGGAAERRVAAHIVVDPPVADGTKLDTAVIAREVKARISALRGCYERALKHNPAISGRIVMRFTITASGTVSDVNADEDTLNDPELTACLRALVMRWRFPAPADGPAEVAFPFVFNPAS